MADTNVRVIVSADDRASGTLRNVGSEFESFGSKIENVFKTGGLAAAGFLASVSLLGKSMLSTAGDMEQMGIAFETMVGNSDEAKQLLNEISDFAIKTPFDLPKVQDGAKRLLAYNVAAKDVIPTFTMLGNIASGVGTEKLPQLILAFGQVKAATKLTGAELRQFSEAGVPLLQALVDKANSAGGSWVTMGGSAKKTGKDVDELNFKLSQAKLKLDEATKSGKSKQSTLNQLEHNVAKYTAELNKANASGGEAKKVWVENTVTAADMIEKIRDGAVSFEDVQEALTDLSNNKFGDLMAKQSDTLQGRLSNLRDAWVRFSSKVVGVDQTGLVKTGSIFDMISKALGGVLDVLEKVQDPIVNFIDKLLESEVVLLGIVGAIGGALVLGFGAFLTTFGAGIIVLGQFLAIGATVGAIIGTIVDALGGFEGIKGTIEGVGDSVKNTFSGLEPVISGYIEQFKGHFAGFRERAYKAFNLDITQVDVGFFDQLLEKIRPGLDNVVAQIKQGFTNAFKINFGEDGNIGDLLGRLMGIAEQISDIFFRLLTPAIEAFKKGIEAAGPNFDKLLQQIGPLLVNALQILGVALGVVLGLFLGLMSGIVQAVSFALPFVIQIFTGFAEFINGIMNIIVGIITLNLGQVWQGFKDVFNGIKDIVVGVLGAVLGAIVGFVKGVIDFFKILFEVLIGNSIIPDIVNGILNWFTSLKDKALNLIGDLIKGIAGKFSGLIGDALSWGRDLIGNFLNGIKNKLSGLTGSVKSFLVDKLGIPSELQFQTGGVVPGPIGAPTLATVHGGETITPAGIGANRGGNGGSGIELNVSIGLYAGTETEKRNIAKDLYAALLQVAKAQNKSVAELMGG